VTSRPAALAARRGLSLIEVLVALVIFLMSFAAIGALIDFGSKRARAATMTTLGTRLALSKLAEVEAGLTPVNSPDSGTCEGEPDWTYDIEPGGQLALNTYPVTVRVSSTVDGRPFSVSLTQVIFDPAFQGKAAAIAKPTDASTGGP
jgi:general secretion pathway protein I